MEKNTRGDRLRIARERLGLNQADMAKKLGLAVSTYSSKERAQQPGGRDFKWEEAKGWSPHLQCDASWLYTGEGASPVIARAKASGSPTRVEQHTTPVIGWFGVPTGEGSLYGFDADRLERQGFATDRTVALEIKGRSLAEGMYAFFEDHREPFKPGGLQGLAVLGLEGNRIVLRRVKGAEIEHYETGSAQVVDRTRIVWASKIVAIAPR
jgi:transcriptional regulator with XRE-family HTH domain